MAGHTLRGAEFHQLRLADAQPARLLTPVTVSDPTDSQIAHLHGQGLSRGSRWMSAATQASVRQGGGGADTGVVSATTTTQPVGVWASRAPPEIHGPGPDLSRAWCWRRLAESLPADDPRVPVMRGAVTRHADASLDQATGSDYTVEHWLAAYAVLLLT